MSAPAANALSLPVSTIAPIAGSASRSSNAAPSSAISPGFSAFSACGRFSVTIPTAPRRSTRMLLYSVLLIAWLPRELKVAAALALALPLGAEEGRAAGLGDAAHALGASAARTGLAFAAIDRPAMLEIAELAIGLHIVPKSRPASVDRHDDA